MDQTEFNDHQTVFQSPPTPNSKKDSIDETTQPDQAKQKKPNRKLLLLVGLIGFTAILFGSLFAIQLSQNSQGNLTDQFPDINLNKPETKPPTEFGTRLQTVKQQIQDADPATIDVKPPPIDFNLVL